MRVLTHTVIEAEAGQPVKQLLHLWGISGSFLSRLKFRQAITVNGAPVTVRFVPCPGDVLAADVSDQPGDHPHIRPVDFPGYPCRYGISGDPYNLPVGMGGCKT